MNVAKMYDDVSERYQKLVDDSHYVGPRWISGKLKTFPIEQGSALDLACATGSIGHVVKNHYPDLTIHGLDISSKMVDKARHFESGTIEHSSIDLKYRPLEDIEVFLEQAGFRIIEKYQSWSAQVFEANANSLVCVAEKI